MNKLKIDRIQSQCLRICCGALMPTSISSLEVECGVMPLDIRRRCKQVKLAVRYKCLDTKTKKCFTACGSLQSVKFNDQFKPIQSKVNEFMNLLPDVVPQVVVSTIPPWEFPSLSVDIGLHEIVSKKLDNPHFIQTSALQHMSRYLPFLKIFCDGSKKGVKTGCAFYIPCLKYEGKYRLNDNSSVYEAELFAILKALEFLLCKPSQCCVVFFRFS